MIKSAGVLLYRMRSDGLKVLLVHPGGPLWSGKDKGAWSIPKGLIDKDKLPREAALREFYEETGCTASEECTPLTAVKLKGGKTIFAWACEGDCDAAAVTSNTFAMEWPPRSGRKQEFPEVDRAGWFTMDEALKKITSGQIPLLHELARKIDPSKKIRD